MEDLSQNEIIQNSQCATFQIHLETFLQFKKKIEFGAQLVDFDYKTFLQAAKESRSNEEQLQYYKCCFCKKFAFKPVVCQKCDLALQCSDCASEFKQKNKGKDICPLCSYDKEELRIITKIELSQRNFLKVSCQKKDCRLFNQDIPFSNYLDHIDECYVKTQKCPQNCGEQFNSIQEGEAHYINCQNSLVNCKNCQSVIKRDKINQNFLGQLDQETKAKQKLIEQQRADIENSQKKIKILEQRLKILKDEKFQQIKEKIFYHLQKIFTKINPFIQEISEEEYTKIEKEIKNEIVKNEIYEINNVTEYLVQNIIFHQCEQIEEFKFKNFLQVIDDSQYVEDPLERIYTQNEVFLNLKDLINCQFVYQVSKNLENDINLEKLQKELIGNLKNKKQILKKVKNFNFYGNEYTEIELSDVDDEISQKSMIQQFLKQIEEAGFIVQNQELLNIDKIFESLRIEDQDQIVQIKNQWAQDICKSIIFDIQRQQNIDPIILNFLNAQEIKIDNCDPQENIELHKEKIEDLKIAKIISEPKIILQKSEQANNISQELLNIMIQSKIKEFDNQNIIKQLFQIVVKQIDWQKIFSILHKKVKEIALNVKIEGIYARGDLKIDETSMKEIKDLEIILTKQDIKEQIDSELSRKLGLSLGVEFDQKISNCIIILLWIEISKQQYQLFDQLY